MKKYQKIFNLLLVLLIVFTYVTPILAQNTFDVTKTIDGEEMMTGTNEKIHFVVTYVLPLFAILGIGIAGAYLYFGHPEGPKKVVMAMAGMFLLGVGPKIVMWAIG